MNNEYKESIKKSKERKKSGIIFLVREILINYLKDFYISDDDLNIIRNWYKDDHDFINKGSNDSETISNKKLLYVVFDFYFKQKLYRSKELEDLIIQKTPNINDSFQSKAYFIITNISPYKCQHHNTMKFKTFDEGYTRVCNPKCKCVVDKRKETSIERYGVDNPSKSDHIKQKTLDSNIKKYGVDNPAKTDVIKNKIKDTNQKRYGVNSTLELDFVQEKIKQTNLKNCGYDNPFKSPENRKKNQEIMMEKYGYKNPFESPEIQKLIKQTNLKNIGVENPFESPEIQEKVRKIVFEKYGTYFNRKHIDSEYIDLLESKEKLEEFLKNHDIRKTSKIVGCHKTTILKYIKKHGIEYDHKRSSYEIEIENWLKEQEINCISNTRSIISPLELDFFLPDYNVAIEFNGLYWHSDIFKEKNYHLNKYLVCKEKNIRLISINEDEWIEKSDLIKSKILNIIGKSEKGLPARKLFVSKIDSHVANKFCEKYHIQGKTGQIIYAAGAFDDCMVLVGVMLFNKQRNTGDIELIRFCTDGKVHNGLFSKLLKFSIKENNFDSIISFADLRYSEGNLYEKTGFNRLSIIKPDYRYIKNVKTFHKSNFSKNSMLSKGLFTEEEIKNKTEKELTEELGLCRIYDIGKIKYVFV